MKNYNKLIARYLKTITPPWRVILLLLLFVPAGPLQNLEHVNVHQYPFIKIHLTSSSRKVKSAG
jgi:hypothetical protein